MTRIAFVGGTWGHLGAQSPRVFVDFRPANRGPVHLGRAGSGRCLVGPLKKLNGQRDSRVLCMGMSEVNGKSTPRAGTISLILATLAVYAGNNLLGLPLVKHLALNHAKPRWWTFVTSLFCHGSWSHLSGNLFFLLVFGRFVEAEEGALFVWIEFVLCGLLANIVSFLFLPPQSLSVGASGGIFGLLTVSLVSSFRTFRISSIIEGLILGQFVVERVREEAKMATGKALGGSASRLKIPWIGPKAVSAIQVNHLAHVAGAIAGIITPRLVRALFTSRKSGQSLRDT